MSSAANTAIEQIPGEVCLINDGDSLLDRDGSETRIASLSLVPHLLAYPLKCKNVAKSGQTLAERVKNFTVNVGPRYEESAAIVIVHILCGGNDIRRMQTTAADLFTLLKAYVVLVHGLGRNTCCLVSTYPLQCDTVRKPPNRDITRAFNDLIYAGWSKDRASGGLGADGLVDYFGNRQIGPGAYSSSAFCDDDWSGDHMHLNDRGKAVMAEIEAEAVSRLIADKIARGAWRS